MVERPNPSEWDTSLLPPDRRDRLELAPTFEDLVDLIVANGTILEAKIAPYRTAPKDAPKVIHQVVYRIAISPELFDPFYNGADGLRGRYWQGPGLGDAATRLLIDKFEPRLLRTLPDQYSLDRKALLQAVDVLTTSLRKPSAKVWPFEWEDPPNNKITLIKPDHPERLMVGRWAENETHLDAKGPSWRWTPASGSIEIKGALVSPEHEEFVPECKKNRADQIYKFGFT